MREETLQSGTMVALYIVRPLVSVAACIHMATR